jgi:hypothetical protein
MRVHVLIGLVAACSLSPWSGASAQSLITMPILDAPLNVAPGEEVIVREREYIIRRRPVLSDPVLYARPVPIAPIPFARPAGLVRTGDLEPFGEEEPGYEGGSGIGTPESRIEPTGAYLGGGTAFEALRALPRHLRGVQNQPEIRGYRFQDLQIESATHGSQRPGYGPVSFRTQIKSRLPTR